MQQVPDRHLDSAAQSSFDELSRRYKVLLHATDVAARRGFPDLLQELSQLLRELFDFNFLNYAIRDDQAGMMRVHMVDEELRVPDATGFSSTENCAAWVWSQQKPLVISDALPDSRFGPVLNVYAPRGFHALVILPMSTARRRLGTLCLGSVKVTRYDDEVLYFLERLASLVGLALENTLSTDLSVIKQALRSEEEHIREIAALRLQLSERTAAAHEALCREQEQLEVILQMQNALAASRINLHQMFPAITAPLNTEGQPTGAVHDISNLKEKLAKQTISLQQDIHGAVDLQEIVGNSRALATVLQHVKTVAPSSATVLILGETGTGKELVARAIHQLSPRSGGNFVKLNCAAIPTGLLESELFGHEKGAFTGAISQKIGRLELAHKGTMFLDEVGEIPLELQPKLLRVLQDQEFERLGGNRTIRVDVRVLAATNRNISKAVANHEFRSDLYYRLHVFPIRLPSLRQRPEDIPILVHYFVQKFALRMHKTIENIPAETMDALSQWYWPGNIRELENFMERSVILTEGPSLRVPVDELGAMVEDHTPETQPSSGNVGSQGTLEELERQYIVQVLRQSAGVLSGSRGAAARLGMKRTTLQSKMQPLGITREEYAS
jgi:transcriptional regulator with GAF, ATPase, and Fis domain